MITPHVRYRDAEELRRSTVNAEIDELTLQVIDDMLHIMRASGYPAMSAPQLGIDRRVIAVDLSRRGRSPIVLVDPTIVWRSDETQVDREGCVSLPNVMARVRRPVQITVAGHARSRQRVRIEAGGVLARILQHQIDHLNGVLILDRIPPRDRVALSERVRGIAPACPLGGTAAPGRRWRRPA